MALPLNDELDLVRAADARFLATLDDLDEAELRAPSLLPGWSRAHVVAHLTRNAEGMLRALAGLHSGAPAPIYLSQQRRAEDIEADQSLDRDTLVGRSHDLHERLLDLFAKTTVEQWDGEVHRLVDADPWPARDLVPFRHREIEIHHADLGAAYSPDRWPLPFSCSLLDRVQHDRGTGPVCLLVAGDVVSGGRWRVGPESAGDGPEISGTAAALAWWLVGRGAGAGLTCSAGPLPDLGSWR